MYDDDDEYDGPRVAPLELLEIPPRLREHLYFNESDHAHMFLEVFAPFCGVETPRMVDDERYGPADDGPWCGDGDAIAAMLVDSIGLVESLLVRMGGEDFQMRVTRLFDRMPASELLDAVRYLNAGDRPIKGTRPTHLRHFENSLRRELAGEWGSRLQTASTRIGKRPRRQAGHRASPEAIDPDPTPKERREDRRAERRAAGRLGLG